MSKRPWNKAQATKLAEALHVPVEEIEELEDALTETATATEEVATVDPAQARWDKAVADAEAAHTKRVNSPLTKAKDAELQHRSDSFSGDNQRKAAEEVYNRHKDRFDRGFE